MVIVRSLRLLAFFITFFISISLFAKSEADKSSKIFIDGKTSDFDAESDQVILAPHLSGRNKESEADSRWGSYIDINTIKITWDTDYLYIATDGILNGNNTIMYLDTGLGLGVSSAGGFSAWKRRLLFENIKPNYFLATWDNNYYPQFYKINSASSVSEKTAEISARSSFNSTVKGSMEAKIPWDTLYSLGVGRVASGATLKILGVIVGGDDTSAPDSAPNTTSYLPSDSDEYANIDNYIILPVDSDNDGYADLGKSIRTIASIAVDTTSLKYQNLEIRELKVDNRAFTPNDDNINDELEIYYFLTKNATVSTRIYNISGDLIYTYQKSVDLTAGYQMIQWNGYNNNRIKANPGLYLIHIEAMSSGVTVVRKVGAYLVN